MLRLGGRAGSGSRCLCYAWARTLARFSRPRRGGKCFATSRTNTCRRARIRYPALEKRPTATRSTLAGRQLAAGDNLQAMLCALHSGLYAAPLCVRLVGRTRWWFFEGAQMGSYPLFLRGREKASARVAAECRAPQPNSAGAGADRVERGRRPACGDFV